MLTIERLLIADGVLQKAIEEGYISQDKVDEFAEQTRKNRIQHSYNLEEQLGLVAKDTAENDVTTSDLDE